MNQQRDWYHVTHREDGKWAVIKEGAERAIELFDTQAAARDFGRELAKKAKGELIVHDKQNRIIARSSYMTDHCPPRG